MEGPCRFKAKEYVVKRMLLAGLVFAGALGVAQLSVPQATAQPVDCSLVRCEACPAGQHPKLTPPDCCRCVKD
jgi:hypothetical protein